MPPPVDLGDVFFFARQRHGEHPGDRRAQRPIHCGHDRQPRAPRDAYQHDRICGRQVQRRARRVDDPFVVRREPRRRGGRIRQAEMRDVIACVEPDDRVPERHEVPIGREILSMPAAIAGRIHQQRRRSRGCGVREVKADRMIVETDRAVGHAWSGGWVDGPGGAAARERQEQKEPGDGRTAPTHGRDRGRESPCCASRRRPGRSRLPGPPATPRPRRRPGSAAASRG